MKFLCLVYIEPKTMAALSKSEGATLDHDSLAYDKELSRSGPLPGFRRTPVRQHRPHRPGSPRESEVYRRTVRRNQGTPGGFILIARRTWMRPSRSPRRFRWRSSARSRWRPGDDYRRQAIDVEEP